MPKIVAIASDHAGFELKQALKPYIEESLGLIVNDLGTHDTQSVDYPDYGAKAAEAIASGEADYGVIICGSGIGISIAANRNPKARAALCHNAQTAKLARLHNDANILALGARIIDQEIAQECIDAFFTTEFEGGRHQARVEKLSKNQ